MYQEDYVSLITATELGQRMTYSPPTYSSLLPSFKKYLSEAVLEVTTLPFNSVQFINMLSSFANRVLYIHTHTKISEILLLQVSMMDKLNITIKAQIMAQLSSQ